MLSPYACKNENAIRFIKEKKDPYRTDFFRDIDRILYSLSFTRYLDKTQVFSFNEDDHITKRMIHVQLVSKIARTIGRNLNLNEDLIEAAALGHDLGHVPFGHVGESILNAISLENGEGYFNHNIESVRVLMNLEQNGKGRNLTLQVLDAIMCHNGELPLNKYKPIIKTKEQFLNEYEMSYQDKSIIKKLRPMTLEGCVVRVSDIIAYIGKDIEDALRLEVIKKEELPKNLMKLIGEDNKDIVNTFVCDVIKNSKGKNYIKMSKPIFKALLDLKKFNMEHIYLRANTKKEISEYERMFKTLFETFKKDVEKNNKRSAIYTKFLKDMNFSYLENTSSNRKVIDFLAGMTDDYMRKCYLKVKETK